MLKNLWLGAGTGSVKWEPSYAAKGSMKSCSQESPLSRIPMATAGTSFGITKDLLAPIGQLLPAISGNPIQLNQCLCLYFEWNILKNRIFTYFIPFHNGSMILDPADPPPYCPVRFSWYIITLHPYSPPAKIRYPSPDQRCKGMSRKGFSC